MESVCLKNAASVKVKVLYNVGDHAKSVGYHLLLRWWSRTNEDAFKNLRVTSAFRDEPSRRANREAPGETD
jgi:hypothetical protein